MGPFDPEKHDRQEPQGAGVMWWTAQAAKVSALVAIHGDMLTGAEAGRFLGVTRVRVQHLRDRGIIRGFTCGRNVFYPLKDLRALIDRRANGKPVTGRGNRATPVFEAA